MKIYRILSKVPFLKRYSFKFLFVAFLGIHIPLLGVIFYIISVDSQELSKLNVFILVLLFTLFATAVTLFILNSLLHPLTISKNALVNYMDQGTTPDLPEQFDDEAGILMKNLQQTITKIDNMMKTQENLTALLSHDLRTPIANLIGLGQVLEQETDPSEVKRLSRYIADAGQTQLDLLDDLLALMKLDDDHVRSEKSEIKVRKIVQSAISHHQSKIQEKSLEIEQEIEEHLTITAHKTLFPQIVANLVSNAIKFSNPQGKIRIEGVNENGQFIFKTIDQGIGLSPGSEKAIFDKFTVHGRSGTHNEKSTGLGLYLVKRIVESHDGIIHAYSEGSNKGTTFEVKIPQQA